MVYLLHLDTPLPRGTSKAGQPLFAGHYIGYSTKLATRLQHHENGTGARFMQVCKERGVTWQLARVWEGGRDLERHLKAQRNAPRLCPICNPELVANGIALPAPYNGKDANVNRV